MEAVLSGFFFLKSTFKCNIKQVLTFRHVFSPC